MSLNVLGASRSSRFAIALADSEYSKPIYDRVLRDFDDFVVVPTLGSIVPRWVLLIPKNHGFNFASLGHQHRFNPVEKISEVSKAFRFDPAETVWFEHGAATLGSETGCGVDHAHIHVIFSPKFNARELRATFETESKVEWTHVVPSQSYERISGERDYYVFSDGREAVVHNSGRQLGSQYFRKQIAKFIGCPNLWDYKCHSFLSNIEKTAKQLRLHENASALA